MDDELDFPALEPNKAVTHLNKKEEIEIDISSTLESLYGEVPEHTRH